MAKKNGDMLSGIQVVALVASGVIGMGIMTLPNGVATEMKANSAVATLLGGVFAVLATAAVALLCRRFPRQTVLDFSKSLVGTIPTKLINGLLMIYFIINAAVAVRVFAGIMKLFLLEFTPLEVIILTFLLLTLYLVQNGISPIARICEAFFPIIVISMSILLILSLQNFDGRELMSSWQFVFFPGRLIKGILATMFSFLGFEVLFFATAFMEQPKKAVKYGMMGTGIAAIFYVFTVVACIGVFSEDALQFLLYPTLELAKTISFPGAFAERFDIFLAIYWILSVFTTVAIYHYLAAFCSARLIGMRNYKPFCWLLVPVIYIVSLIPGNISQVVLFMQWISYAGVALILGIFAVLMIMALIKRKRGKEYEQA